MIIAEMPKATGVYRHNETVFTGASLWEYQSGVGTRCVWSGELSSESKLRELVSGWKQMDVNWRPYMVALDNRHTGDTYLVDIPSLLA